MTGRFITIEGPEGVGKTTNVEFVVAHLRAQGLDVVETREPGGTPLAERIRGLLLEAAPGEMPPVAELLLVFAARASHLRERIRPALERGAWVVCDRFTDATYAYQGGGRGLEDTAIAELERRVQDGLRPDLTLLLDAPPEVTGHRRQARATDDRFEREDAAFFARVRARYLELARTEPCRVRLIDAAASLPAVRAAIAAALDAFVAANVAP